jgi:hypothetical protein
MSGFAASLACRQLTVRPTPRPAPQRTRGETVPEVASDRIIEQDPSSGCSDKFLTPAESLVNYISRRSSLALAMLSVSCNQAEATVLEVEETPAGITCEAD